MLSKPELARFLIGLVEANDADLIDDDSLLPLEVCAADDRPAVRRLRDIVQFLYQDFNYLGSPEFAAMADGKSDAYHAMLRKRWSDPEKRTQQRKKYAETLATLLSEDRAYQLTPPERHPMLNEFRDVLRTISNPDGDEVV